MKSQALIGLLLLVSLTAACGGDTPTTPSPASSSVTFTATLLPSSEVPPINGTEANGSGTGTVTFNVTKDGAGTVTAATMDAMVSVNGFPAGTTLTGAHIHPGAAGANGGILVSLGLVPGEVTFAPGSGSFTKQGITVPVDQANAIIANPGGFYLNIHTAANPGGVARGQLIRAQ